MSRLSTGLNSLFQDKLSNNLIVSGVPAADGENLEKVFIKIASLLNVDLSSSDFKVKRINSKVNNKFSNLLVEFNDIKFKSTLLKNKKNISLLPSKLGFDSDKREILFFHQLTNQLIISSSSGIRITRFLLEKLKNQRYCQSGPLPSWMV